MNAKWKELLKDEIDGEVHFDKISRHIYSIDASIFEVEPLCIVFPKTENDILKTVRIARDHSLPLIARGAGTGLTGGCLGEGIILDCSKYLNRILSIDIENNYVVCEPGVIQDHLNKALEPFHMRLGPDTSTGNRATIGGMLANNAAGAHSMRYGRMVDAVEEVDLILSNAEKISLGKSSLCHDSLHEKIYAIINEFGQEIRKYFPKTPRRSSGYSLDELVKEDTSLNLAKLIASSEGTLGIVTKIKIRIEPIPAATALLVLHFTSLQAALSQVTHLLEFKPFALELICNEIIRMGRLSASMQGALSWLKGDPDALLVLELDAHSEAELDTKISHFQKNFQTATHAEVVVLKASNDKNNVWKLRKAGLGLLMSRRSYSRAIAFVEDVAVPPENLAAFMHEFIACLKSYNVEAGIYGHAGPGCIHVRPFIDLRDPKSVSLIQDIMKDVLKLVHTYKGVLSGEHGDGLIRSFLNKELFGTKIYQAFCALKDAFDPLHLMNPGKIVASKPSFQHLKNITASKDTIDTFLDFSKEGGFHLAVDMCNGNGECRKHATLMCPTFQAYNDEYHSTRARAQSLRTLVNGKKSIEGFTSKELLNVLDLCIECKGCKTECPSSVDMAKMKTEFMYQYQKRKGIPFRSWFFANAPYFSKLSSYFPTLSNFLLTSPLFKSLLSCFGISPTRTLPTFSKTRFSRKASYEKRLLKLQPSSNEKKIVLMIDTYTEFYHPEIGLAAHQILTHLGYHVSIPKISCCSRPLISKGLLEQARKGANKLIDILHPFAENNIPIIGLEPSCISALRDDYSGLLNHERSANVSKMIYSLDEFLEHKMSHLALKTRTLEVALHTHCHQKALISSRPTLTVLKNLPGALVHEIDSGCCGLAGSFGYEKEHADFSMAIGETRLFPAIRKLHKDCIIVASGFSCRYQIAHGTGKKAMHLAEIVQAYLT